VLSITLDDLSPRIAPKVVIVCEGSSVGNRRKDFDAEVYNRVLGSQHPDVVFISGGSSSQVQHVGVSVREALEKILPNAKLYSLADRDDTSDREVAERSKRGQLTLPVRNLESYLLAEEVIDLLVKREQKPGLLQQALEVTTKAITASIGRGNPEDDLKSAAGEVYTGLKSLLGLQRCGNNTDAFLRDTLAPLITPATQTFQAMKAAIIDKVL
jgi:hypothetical protein